MFLVGLLGAFLWLWSLGADADPVPARRRVALLRPDAEWLRSAALSLASWDIEVVAADAEPPESSDESATAQVAEALARRFHADVVAWTRDRAPQTAIWMYDVETRHIEITSVESRLPFDDVGAAAAALSLKSMLRSSAVAPAAERVPPALPAWPGTLRLEAEAGGRWLSNAVSEPRGGLGLSIWPRALREHLGLGVVASTGPGAHVQSPSIDGQLSEVTLQASLRSRLRFGTRFALEPALGASVHWTRFGGTVTTDDEPFQEARMDPGLDAALAGDVLFGNVMIGLRACAGLLLQSQRYFVGSTTVLGSGAVLGDVVLRISAGVF